MSSRSLASVSEISCFVIIGLFTANFFGQLVESRQSLFSGAKRQLVLCARVVSAF